MGCLGERKSVDYFGAVFRICLFGGFWDFFRKINNGARVELTLCLSGCFLKCFCYSEMFLF